FDSLSGMFGEYEWLTTTEADHVVSDFGSGLDKIYSTYVTNARNLAGQQQPLGIYSRSRAEWLLAELSAFYTRRYSVGISDSASVEQFESSVNETGLQVVLCSIDKVPRMLERIKSTPGIKVIISMDRLDCSKPNTATQTFNIVSTSELKSKADALDVALMDMDQVIEIGRINPARPIPPRPSDISTICYTAGTTGKPRAVVITHAAFAYAVHATYLSLALHNAVYLSCVPLHLVADRHNVYALMHGMVRVGFSSGNTSEDMFADMQKLRPTIVFALPQQLRSVYAEVVAATTAASGLSGILSRIGLSIKMANYRKGKGLKHPLWDRLAFKDVVQRFGGSLQTLIIGYSVLQPQVHDFFRATLSCNVIHRYGLTELAGGGIMQSCEDPSTGSIGVPQPGIDVCLRSVPSVGYNVTDTPCPRGVLLVRSQSVSLADGCQASSMDEEWLATGDIARFNADGSFTIIDRLSSIVALSSGGHAALGHLESIYSAHPALDVVVACVEEHGHELAAIAVPNPHEFVAWARKVDPGGSVADLRDLCANRMVTAAMAEELNSLAMKEGVAKTQRLGSVYLMPSMLGQATGSVFTETFSVRRGL
ncbi:medium-chain fatty acid-CoA ligase faa2, partial [Coemansia sp. RSA 2599]